MKIVLRDDMADLFQEGLDTIKSYYDEDDPQKLINVCNSFRNEIMMSVDFALEMPSYIALALLNAVDFKTPHVTCELICDGNLPSWNDFRVRQSCVKLKEKLEEIDNEVALKAAVVAFCLSNQNIVIIEGGTEPLDFDLPQEKGEDDDWE